ncbi:MAG: hypothetical protein GXO37_06215 [Chloroflexi bacterium]|nr:hypothetical protein [Chloroflexota bacterium]
MASHDPPAAVRALLARGRTAAIVSHINPDGDAVGSLLGLGHMLQQAGLQVTLALADPVPENLLFLPAADTIVRRVATRPDILIAVDSGARERLGDAVPAEWPIDLNIDHHKANTLYGRLNVVVPDAPSTTTVLAEHAAAWGLTITPPAAQALLTGLLTDTLGLRTAAVKPATLRLVARLMELGAPLSTIYYEALVARSFAEIRYLGRGKARAQMTGRVIWSYLTRRDRAETGFTVPDDAGLVNALLNAREADLAVVFVETDQPQLVKVSWRAKEGWDVSELARAFGGGGHAAAAGARVPGELAAVQQRVLAATMHFHRTHQVPQPLPADTPNP